LVPHELLPGRSFRKPPAAARRASPLALLFLIFAACSDGTAPARTGGFNLAPQWRGQEKVEVREERVEFQGAGPYPAAADLQANAKRTEREVDVYHDTVLTGAGVTLDAIHRRYLSSVLTAGGKAGETAVDGNSYIITDPLQTCRVQREVTGAMVPASEEETKKIRRSILRIAASLLPKKPVREGETWLPGRDLSVLALQGNVDADMRARLEEVVTKDGRKLATIRCDIDARIPDGQRIGARISVRETLLFDIEGGRVSTYHAATERYFPPAPRREESWVKTVTDVSVTKLR
jgi:hypothetical protein